MLFKHSFCCLSLRLCPAFFNFLSNLYGCSVPDDLSISIDLITILGSVYDSHYHLRTVQIQFSPFSWKQE